MIRSQVALFNFHGLLLPQVCARLFKEKEEERENCGLVDFHVCVEQLILASL